MAQIKVFGLEERLQPMQEELSNVIHSCLIDALGIPTDKKFHRFFPMKKDNYYFPNSRTDAYTIIEISMFEGRTIETKKYLLQLLFERINSKLNLSVQDIEITIIETPQYNWGIRGVSGDELSLSYKVDV